MISILFLLNFFVPDTQSYFVLEKEFIGEYKKIYADHLGMIYLINSKNNLFKLDSIGNVNYTFEDKSFPVYQIDVSNPMRTLLYNQQQNSLIFVDKTLSPFADRIHLDLLEIPYTNGIAASRDNNFWVFDNTQQTLKKFNQQSQNISNSGNLITATGTNIQPIELCESGDYIYALDSTLGVFQFDYLGTYLFQFKDIKAKKIEISGKNIVFLKDKELYIYDSILMEKKQLILPGNPIILDFALSAKKIVVLTEQKVLIFRSGS